MVTATRSPGQRAYAAEPETAILDELTTGLDPQARRDTWELIERVRDRGVTIILVTHFMDEAERLCDRVLLIDRGVAAAPDTPAAWPHERAATLTCGSSKDRSEARAWIAVSATV